MTPTQETATQEVFSKINEDKDLKSVWVEVSYCKDDETALSRDTYNITDDNYDLLMSQSPEFAPDKPANEYREVDLWYIIDLIRSEQS
jgi:hypothetical protein